MAVVTISRQLASFGDEIGARIAEKLGYKFVGKEELEKRIVSLGFPKDKLSKFDDKKLGFFAGLTHIRGEYVNYLVTAILEAAAENNCVIVGRGSFIILKDLENHVSCRIIADEKIRAERVMKDMGCDRKSALKKITGDDARQKSFHKEFFNFDVQNPAMFDLLVSTSSLGVGAIVESVAALANNHVTPQKDALGQQKIEELLLGQRIVSLLVFIAGLNISFLRASIDGRRITLHGISDSKSTVDMAINLVSAELPGYQIESAISVEQNFKVY